MNNNIKCTVTNCLYNSSEICTAKHVDVYSNGDGLANTSSGTSCRTFRPQVEHTIEGSSSSIK